MRTIAAVLATCILGGCSDGSDLDCLAVEPSIVTMNDQQQGDAVFAVGEAITLRVTIANFKNEPVTVGSPLCPALSYRIRDAASQLVWSLGSDTSGYQFIGECAPSLTLEPGDNPVHAFPWDQRAIASEQIPDNTQVPVGTYEVAVSGTDCHLEASAAFSIQ